MSTDNVTFSYTISKSRTLYCLLPYIQGLYYQIHKKRAQENSIILILGV